MRLVEIATAVLEELEYVLRIGELRWPPTRSALASVGLVAAQLPEEVLSLDRACAVAVLRAVLGERRRPQTGVELVWTGPEPLVSGARDTAVVVRELFAGAQRSVLVAGFQFDHGAELLAPLHRSMMEHGARVDIFLDLKRRSDRALSADEAEAQLATFAQENWPFGEPWPELFVDARTLSGRSYSSLHAKCVAVDGEVALVTSANFTDRGQTRNIELGALVREPGFVSNLERQWRASLQTGIFVAAPTHWTKGA